MVVALDDTRVDVMVVRLVACAVVVSARLVRRAVTDVLVELLIAGLSSAVLDIRDGVPIDPEGVLSVIAAPGVPSLPTESSSGSLAKRHSFPRSMASLVLNSIWARLNSTNDRTRRQSDPTAEAGQRRINSIQPGCSSVIP